MISIGVANTGIRAVVVSNIFLKIGKTNLYIDYQMFGRELQLSVPRLPFELQPEQELNVFIPYTSLKNLLQEHINRRTFSPNRRIYIMVTDKTDGKYYKDTKLRVNDLIKKYL